MPRDHHHLGARARLVDMGGRHWTRATAGRDTSRTTAGRQTGPVGVVGLKGRQGSKEGDDRDRVKVEKQKQEDGDTKMKSEDEQ